MEQVISTPTLITIVISILIVGFFTAVCYLARRTSLEKIAKFETQKQEAIARQLRSKEAIAQTVVSRSLIQMNAPILKKIHAKSA